MAGVETSERDRFIPFEDIWEETYSELLEEDDAVEALLSLIYEGLEGVDDDKYQRILRREGLIDWSGEPTTEAEQLVQKLEEVYSSHAVVEGYLE